MSILVFRIFALSTWFIDRKLGLFVISRGANRRQQLWAGRRLFRGLRWTILCSPFLSFMFLFLVCDMKILFSFPANFHLLPSLLCQLYAHDKIHNCTQQLVQTELNLQQQEVASFHPNDIVIIIILIEFSWAKSTLVSHTIEGPSAKASLFTRLVCRQRVWVA